MPRITREKFKTMHNVFDEFTNQALFKLISQGHFSGLESPISIGKEANIFSAIKEDQTRVMIKIYRLEACDFNKMYTYIKEDPRYIDLKGKKRKIIFAWVQREFRNLMKAREANVRVPKPITFLNNIIVMEFIGNKDEIAPKLKDLVPNDKKRFFDDIVENVRKLYKADLVHADLSPFNILNHNDKPVLIDFSQTCPIKSASAKEFLKRDLKNVINFFSKLGMKIDDEKTYRSIVNVKNND